MTNERIVWKNNTPKVRSENYSYPYWATIVEEEVTYLDEEEIENENI